MSDKVFDRIEWATKVLLRLSVVALLVVVVVKVATTEFVLSFVGITFEQVISLVLALFAVVLSLAFYFGANDTSQKFHNQMFTFIKETSVILGSIEAGFKERLDRIGSEYGELSGRIERAPAAMLQVVKELKATTFQIDQTESDQRSQVRDLIDHSGLSETEKSSIKAVLDGSAQSVAADRTKLKESINELEGVALRAVPDHVNGFLRERIVPGMKRRLKTQKLGAGVSDEQLRHAFLDCSKAYSRASLMALRDAGLATSDRDLTDAGIEFIKSMWE